MTIIALDQRADRVYVTAELESGARLRVTASAYFTAEPGDIWLFSGRPTWPERPLPGEFDYGRWLIRQHFSGVSRGGLTSTTSTVNSRQWFVRQLSRWRRCIISQIRWLLPEPEASFLAGLLIGSRADLPVDVTEQLRRTGTSHVIAVSGANVVIIGGSVLWLARFVLQRARPAFWLTLLTIWLFVLLTGASAAAARGGVTATITTITSHHGRDPPAGRLIWLTTWLMLIVNPFIYLDVGWQLSIAAFAGLLFLGPTLTNRLANWPTAIRRTSAETTAASLATMPISMLSFGTFTLTGLIANPLVLWLIPPATFVGLSALLVTAACPALWLPARIIAWLPLHLALTAIKWLARLPLSWQV